MPRMSSLHYPAPRLPALVSWHARIPSTTRCDVSFVALQHYHAMRWGVVIGGIQTQMLWLCRAWTWPHHCTVIEQLSQHRSIIDVCRRHHNTEGNSPAINQNMVFDAGFGAIRRVRPSLFFPPPATARRCRRHFAIPSRCRAAHHRGANTWHESARILRHASTLQSGHKRSATGRTLWVRHATNNQPRAHRGWHQGSSDHWCEGVRHVQVAVWVGAPSRSPPTTHQEHVGVFSYRQFTKPLRFADTHLAAEANQ